MAYIDRSNSKHKYHLLTMSQAQTLLYAVKTDDQRMIQILVQRGHIIRG